MRSSTADNFENLTPPKKLTLEESRNSLVKTSALR